MKLRSHIEFPGFIFRHYNPHGELIVCATVSALFDIVGGAELSASAEQRDSQLSDEYLETEAETDHLLRQSDFVPFKLGTDVTAIACSYAPDGGALPAWQAGIAVGEYEKLLNIHGPRSWAHDRKNGWRLTPSAPAQMVPVDYFHAFGGRIMGGTEPSNDVYALNPLGPGVLNDKFADKGAAYPAPQVDSPRQPITTPFEDYTPEGLAPIHPAWAFRQRFAGSYDETWVQTQHPFLPPDFDYHFYNCAHPTLTFGPYLEGTEYIRVAHLHPAFPQMGFFLPHRFFGAVASYRDASTLRSPMALDGVHLELLEEQPKLRLTWRIAFPWKTGIRFIDIGDVPLDSTSESVPI